MNPTMITHLRTLLVHPDRPDRSALFAVLANTHATTILGCLAPLGSLLQIAAALRIGWSWGLEGWERQINELVGLITDPRCSVSEQMITTWSRIPSAVGVLRDRTDTLIAWVQQRLTLQMYAELALLLGPSDESARLLVRYPSSLGIGETLRRWSMVTDPNDPTAWQAMIDADLHAALYQSADLSCAFPAWGWSALVVPQTVLSEIVNDLLDGWSLDHPSLRGRIRWLDHHGSSNLDIGRLALVASIGGSDALAEAVCTHLGHNPSFIPWIAEYVPWSRLHPQIQTVIDETMHQASNDRWTRTWACAIGDAPVVPDTTIDATLLMWRIDPKRWDDLDPPIRASLASRIDPPTHCNGWGVHPDLVEYREQPYKYKKIFHFWNSDVLPDDLRAWMYADLLREQRDRQNAWRLFALLAVLPPDRHARFEQIIDWRLGECPEATAQPPWDWAVWIALPAADRQQWLRDRLAILRGDRATWPALRFWRVRNDGLATFALMVSDVFGLDDPTPILAALLAQVLGLRGDETDIGPSLPFPDNLDAARRAQIERLPLTPDTQAYAAWGLWLLARVEDMGADLLALHPDVAVALAPVLTTEQRAMVTASPVAQRWESMTHLRWVVACAAAKEPPMPPRQRSLP